MAAPRSEVQAELSDPLSLPKRQLQTLVRPRWRITLHDMKTSALTIRLDRDLERRLNRAAKRSGRTRSEFVRDALKRQLAVAQLEDLRRRIMPFAEAQGYLTDEDVFRDVS
jgi:predicted transcriptional regulator